MNSATAPHKKQSNRAGLSLGILAVCLVLAIVAIILGTKVHHLKAQVADLQKQLVQAKSDTAEAQTELDNAKKAASAQQQAQVDKEKADLASQQSLLNLAKDASTQLQSQLDAEKTRSANLQSQVDKDKAQLADMQNQVYQSNSGSAQLLTQLDQAKIQTMDLQSRLQTAETDIAQLQPLLLKLRHMPITTSLEKIHGGRKFTLQIKNLYLQPMNVSVTVTGPGKTRSQSNIIGGGGTLNVAGLSGGEKVLIASEGYDPVALTVQ